MKVAVSDRQKAVLKNLESFPPLTPVRNNRVNSLPTGEGDFLVREYLI